MVKFITVTDNRHGSTLFGSETPINPEHIAKFRAGNRRDPETGEKFQEGTKITLANGSIVFAKETPEEVMALIG